MKIEITKTVRVTERLDVGQLIVSSMGDRDTSSIHLNVSYKDKEIAYGHLNYKSNMAHIEMTYDSEYNQDLEDFLVEGIENRCLTIK